MATNPKNLTSFIVGANTARREQTTRFQRDNDIRSASVTLLNPDEVAGDIDGSRLMMLTTTLHGMSTQLTLEDLAQFRNNVRNLKRRFKGGVSAKAMLERSLKSDRDRANQQITMAVPVSARGGVIHFMTNAGPDSDVKRHHVHVELLNYSEIAAKPKSAAKLAKELLEGAARWDCDCGRHRFWYRYLLTTLKANYGASETAFPKVRNPTLRGTCCKHIARVAHNMLNSPTLRAYVVRVIEQGRKDVTGKRVDLSKQDAKAMAAQAAAESKRKRTIQDPKTPAEKRRATMERKAKEAVKKEAVEKARQASPKAPSKAELRKIEMHARALLAMRSITQAMFNEIIGGEND